MQAQWHNDGAAHKSVSPVSLIVSAFAPVIDVREQLTPLLSREEESELWLIGLGAGKQRLGGSVLAQCFPEASAQARCRRSPASSTARSACRISTIRSACATSSN